MVCVLCRIAQWSRHDSEDYTLELTCVNLLDLLPKQVCPVSTKNWEHYAKLHGLPTGLIRVLTEAFQAQRSVLADRSCVTNAPHIETNLHDETRSLFETQRQVGLVETSKE
ncbi:hypothetical protein BO83DRAFT_27958 [Aspergillus eucalypticola CBS 122712]|uniref:Uncharacterized protein n=1 Tax=Aspergillus eucalypticola (strain CBS 122712 / IBT 29274) TaxID=1448314 RepID=A0A317VJW7_ASPEC|nr:uncharacterized protein BO83DRAFT_27958 [Aspergillus eucalypticola CBS 122712]PWY74215.1 hypothetical protein BO83DRAFT_27958 [Aspergillus eucalypticola CBS 122712]